MAKQLKQYTRVSDIDVGDAGVLAATLEPQPTRRQLTTRFGITGASRLLKQIDENAIFPTKIEEST
jgi:hypothetical protein